MSNVSAGDIQSLYVYYLNRPADPAGLKYWLAADASFEQIANLIASSKESEAKHIGQSSLEVVDSIYVELFGRHAEADGLLYWQKKLDSGAEAYPNLVRDIAHGAQNADLSALNNKLAAANLFTSSLNSPDAMRAYDGPAANVVVRDWLAAITDNDSFAKLTTPEVLRQLADSAREALNHPPHYDGYPFVDGSLPHTDQPPVSLIGVQTMDIISA